MSSSSETADAPRRDPTWVAGLVAAACVVGTILRLIQYLQGRPLWLDEAMLALNIAARGLPELLGRLDYHQVAPPLFLLVERTAVNLGGVNELSLRAFPVLATIATLPVLYLAARRLVGLDGALFAVWLAALAPPLIRYGNEVKPYGVDALVSVCVLLAYALLLERPDSRRWAGLTLVGVVALSLSIPGAFCVGAVAALLLAKPAGAASRERSVIVGATWAAVGLIVYLVSYRATANNPVQHSGYDGAFLIPGADFWRLLLGGVRGTLLPPLAQETSAGVGIFALVATVTLAGCVVVWRRSPQAALAITLPVVFAALASSVRRYPFGVPRMMVFAVPLVILVVCAFAGWVKRRLPPPLSYAFSLVVVASLFGLGARDLEWSRNIAFLQNTPALLEDFKARLRYDEPVYVAARGMPSWLFYTTRWDEPDRERLRFYAEAGSFGLSFENAASRGRPVEDEGFELVYPYRQRREILGVSSGRQWRYPRWTGEGPDEGWAQNEARRIVREANPCFWMFFSQISELAHKPLMWEVRDNYSAERHYQRYERGAVLWRYCLPKYGPKAVWREHQEVQ